MDCYDKIIKMYHSKDRIAKCKEYLAYFINKESKSLTELQFTNCLILILSILTDKHTNIFQMEGKSVKKLQSNEKKILHDLLKKEFID
ncbi:MAG: hypothetical protein ACFFDN_32835 [Candidatus Hodarchaeota archaeon]